MYLCTTMGSCVVSLETVMNVVHLFIYTTSILPVPTIILRCLTQSLRSSFQTKRGVFVRALYSLSGCIFLPFFLSNLISNAYIKDVSDPLMYVGLAYVCHFYFCAEFWLCLPWGMSCKECLQEILFWRQSGFCKKGPQSKVLPTFTK